MDDVRFDTLARRVDASGLTRRGAFRVLAGAALGALLAGAPGADEAEGRAKKFSEGRKHQSPLGIKRCLKTGERCKKKRGRPAPRCCDGSSCQGGRCACNLGTHDPDGDGYCEAYTCLGFNELCSSANECCQDRPGVVACEYIYQEKDQHIGSRTCGGPDTRSRCCLGGGSICASDCDCCGGLTCQNGRCALPAYNHPIGASCTSSNNCFEAKGVCRNGTCCREDRRPCPGACEKGYYCQGCCSGFCHADGTCGSVPVCANYGGACTTNGDCCQGVPCTGGLCRYN